ncbi:MAG TPA: DNA polymerase III subunit delta' [Thermodesulfobacteriota bacterium]|nr:DNA polymerase III subunit delta' [Thermodesulfobacteriota bacterium]
MFFTNVLGHEFQKQALRRAVQDSRISHSYIFSGPDGIGKRLTAIEFAKILNCVSTYGAGEADLKNIPCDCPSCKKIEKGIHPDVFLVEYKGAKDIKVDQIREEVEEKLYFRPFEGRFKVAILDEAERMNQNAQNAFLKTLEEPPSDSVIILITSEPQSLLPTIRSRCQLLEFSPLSEEIIVEEITKRKDQSPDEAVLCARLSGGSLGKALHIDQNLLSQREKMLTKLSNINPNRASEVLGFVESLSSEDIDKLSFMFDVTSLWLRDMVLIKIGFGEDSLSNRDLASVIKQVAEKQDIEAILDKVRFLEKSWYAIFRTNANKQMVLENLVLKMAE